MSDNRRRSPSPSARLRRTDDTSDEPMSHQDWDRRRSDKRRAPHSPSPHHSRPPSREGRHEKRRRVTACDASPSPDRWCATTTGLLLHDRDHRCPTCLEYQKHVSLDIVLETSSIMDAREDCLRCLAHVFGWNARMSGLEDDLASMHRERDYWHKRAEEAEKASTFSQQQTSAAFEQARLLSMYIPSARPEDPTGAGPSSRPLEERLVSPGGGSRVTPASYSGERCSRSRSRSPGRTCFRPNSPGTIFSAMDVDAAELPRSSLAGRLENPEETMFPLLGWGEIPNRVNVLLDGTKYLHVQFNDCLYQFEDPHRENVLRNIRRGIAPLITGAIWPGAVRLLNTANELDEFYAQVAKESEESDSPNTRFGQNFIAWLNRYMADTDCHTRVKPLKNSVMSHAFKHWHPPAWASARGKSKREGYKQAKRAERGNGHTEGEQPSEATSQPPPPAPEVAPPSVTSSLLPPAPEAAQSAASSSLPRAPEVA